MRLLSLSTRARRRIGALTGLAALVGTVGLVVPGSAAATPSEGLDCDTDANNHFTLATGTDYMSTPDGNTIFVWGFANEAKSNRVQLPGPALCVTSGQQVTVVLHNSLPEPVSIVFPGQSSVLADGAPVQPQLDTGGSLTSLAQAAGASGGSVTYTFTAGSPGTYLYSSGSDVEKQVQMGLYGALVVRPAGHADWVSDRADSAFNPAHEYLFVLSEVDPDIHLKVERGESIDWSTYRARYFLINGRSMPDTLAPNHASWLPSQPYGAFVHIKPYDATANPLPASIRYVNAGRVNYPFHPHGSDERVVNQDGRALAGSGGTDLSYEKFDLDVQPGQSIDVLFDWRDAEHWDPATNPVPVELPALTDQLLVGADTWFAESPYLGVKNPVPANMTDNNECGEYYHIAHSHALQQATNYGAAFGGMMTVYRIDPPAGCPGN